MKNKDLKSVYPTRPDRVSKRVIFKNKELESARCPLALRLAGMIREEKLAGMTQSAFGHSEPFMGEESMDPSLALRMTQCGESERTTPSLPSSGLTRGSTWRGLNTARYEQYTQSGRTLVETLATLSIMFLLGISTIKGYHFIVGKTKAQNTAKMIKTLALERQNSAISDTTGARMTVKGPHSSLVVQNGTSGNHQPYFWVETEVSDKAFCQALKESGLIQADLIEVDGVENGNCKDNATIAFYFKKDATAKAYCPDHSSNCDDFGDATGCRLGYYLNNGQCFACGEHVATCEDENTPLTCMDGYNLYGTECLSYTSCETDLDCDVCGECSQDGYCTQMCSIPTPDANDDCGDNECMVYDNATGTCQYACTRKEYLESTGTQYIDAAYNSGDYVEVETELARADTSKPDVIIGNRINDTNDFRLFYPSALCFDYKDQRIYYSAFVSGVDEKVNIKFGNGYLIFNGTKRSAAVVTGISSVPIFLFGGYYNSLSNIYKAKIRISYTKIYDNGELVRDFIPVVSPAESKCGGKPAMFDRVTKKLFCNAGTGEFLTD